jgi:hypothetical protein
MQKKDLIHSFAKKYNLDPLDLEAVIEVESGGKLYAFDPTGIVDPRPLILFEYHVFYRAIKDPSIKELAVCKKLASKRWGQFPYPKTQLERYKLLEEASQLDYEAAHAACSWGLGQVLGESYSFLGYSKPSDLAKRTCKGLEGQLEVFFRFILSKPGCLEALKAGDFKRFFRLYNGPGKVDEYARRFEAAKLRLGGDRSFVTLRLGSSGPEVKRLQESLGENPDGFFGPRTDLAVKRFQTENGLVADGVVGVATWKRLQEIANLLPPRVPTAAAERAEKVRPVADSLALTVATTSTTAIVSNPATAREYSETLGIPVLAVVGLAVVLLILLPRLVRYVSN